MFTKYVMLSPAAGDVRLPTLEAHAEQSPQVTKSLTTEVTLQRMLLQAHSITDSTKPGYFLTHISAVKLDFYTVGILSTDKIEYIQ